ncbi:hypothetical protein CNMCM6936_005869 [Aspergillus lentulus]|nr:hypothetical protein CNMCM6069_006637 [Aspergillus lentulus]KAF4166960.1 hypothetical protein CNMCM6936_005869 [Aspergillus lentulus]
MRCSFLFLAAALVAPTLAISEPAWMKYLAGLDEPADAAEQVDLNYLAHLADIADSVGVANPVTPDELAYLAEIAYLTDGKVKIRNNCPHKVYYWVAVPGNQYGPFAIEHGKESPPETITDGKAIKFTDTRNPPNSCKQVALGVPPGDKYNWEVDKISDGHEFRHDIRCAAPIHPDRSAVTDSVNKFVTYKELSSQLNRIASSLLQNGAYQTPTIFWVASVVAILKTGAVNVPPDAVTPSARLALMVQDCKPSEVLINETTREISTKMSLDYADPDKYAGAVPVGRELTNE